MNIKNSAEIKGLYCISNRNICRIMRFVRASVMKVSNLQGTHCGSHRRLLD